MSGENKTKLAGQRSVSFLSVVPNFAPAHSRIMGFIVE